MVSSYNNTTLSQMRYILKLQYNKTQTYTPQFSVFTICVGHYFVIFIGVNPMFLQMLFSVQNALPCWARRKNGPHTQLLSKNFKRYFQIQRLFLPWCFSTQLYIYLYYTTYHIAVIIFHAYLCSLGYESLEDRAGFYKSSLCPQHIYVV